jgi:hypothetical protein
MEWGAQIYSTIVRAGFREHPLREADTDVKIPFTRGNGQQGTHTISALSTEVLLQPESLPVDIQIGMVRDGYGRDRAPGKEEADVGDRPLPLYFVDPAAVRRYINARTTDFKCDYEHCDIEHDGRMLLMCSHESCLMSQVSFCSKTCADHHIRDQAKYCPIQWKATFVPHTVEPFAHILHNRDELHECRVLLGLADINQNIRDDKDAVFDLRYLPFLLSCRIATR